MSYSPEYIQQIAQWCRENSSGIYRNSAIAADILDTYAATLRQQAGRVDASDLDVLRRLRDALPTVGLNGWMAGVGALDAAITALAQNTQGDGGELYVEARQCEDCDHLGLNDCSDTASACGDCEWQGPTPAEDKCPGCGHENCMAVACPICGGRYRFLADRRFHLHAERARVPEWLNGLGKAVKQMAREGDGFWHPCSGCYETEDGQPVGNYPYSPELQCDVGGGCSECGGLGAVWDDTDYAAMAEELAAAPSQRAEVDRG